VIRLPASEKTLSSVKPGFKEIISHFRDEQVACRCISMGLLPGSVVEILHRAPFGGGCYVKSDRLHVAMRREEACSIVLV